MRREMVRGVIVIGFVALLLALPLRGGAQNGADPVMLDGVLTVMEPASDVLVQVEAGQQVTITLSAPTMDPALTVYDAVGQLLAYNDDSELPLTLPSPRDAALQFTPPDDGLMVVRVGSYHWAYSGPYTLTLSGAVVVEQTPVSIVQRVGGNVVSGALYAQEDRVPRSAYAFPALTGWPITLQLTSEDFDTVLEVYDAQGDLLLSDDDHDDDAFDLPARTDSALTFEAPVDGMYYVLVRSFEDEGSGGFTLVLEGAQFGQASVASEDAPREGVCDNVLGGVVEASSTFGGSYAAENMLDDSLVTGWSSRGDDPAPYIIFEVNTGATVRLDGVVFDGFSSSPGFMNDSVQEFQIAVATTLTDPDSFTTVLQGTAPLENTAHNYTFPPVEARYVLLRMLTNYGGSYFQATEFNACTSLTGLHSGTLSGEPPFIVSDRLAAADPYLEYRVYALDNATLTATVTSEDFDPVLEVYNEGGRLLADNDNHPSDVPLPRLQDAALSLTVSEAGALTVRVRSVVRGGAFVLTVDGLNIQASPPEVPLLPPCRDLSSVEVGGAVVDFSSEFGGRWQAAFLNDGSNETGWASSPGRESARSEYVILDLTGEVQTMAGFRINPSATGGDSTMNNASRFAVLVSTTEPEPEAFEEIFSTLLGERYRYTLAFDLPEPVQARYVMLETRDSFGGRWHEVAEFTVCGSQ